MTTTPAMITMALNDCCVVRAAFSAGLRSLHRTAPVSFMTVTERRWGPDGGTEELVEFGVALAGRVVEKEA